MIDFPALSYTSTREFPEAWERKLVRVEPCRQAISQEEMGIIPGAVQYHTPETSSNQTYIHVLLYKDVRGMLAGKFLTIGT